MRARTVLVGAGLAAVGTLLGRRIADLRPVAPELRRPLLLLPLDVRNGVLLRVLRSVRTARPVLRSDVRRLTIPVPGTPEATVYLYERKAGRASDGALLWIHGGGYVGGAAVMDDEWCARIAAEAGILVASVEYRLAPEHPFPAPLDDCAAALRWLHGDAAERGVDPARIAIGGASAGAGLAAALVQRSVDEGLPVAFQLLEYPMLDDRTVLRVDDEGRGRLGWTAASNRFGWTSYLGAEPGAAEPPEYAAPARREVLAGLPPAWIGVGELDLFYGEDVEYAMRLEDAGVEVELVTVPGMYHGADAIASAAPSMRRFRTAMLDAVRGAVGGVSAG